MGATLARSLEMQHMGSPPYLQPTTDKIMRLHAQTALIENGFVHIPETEPWLSS